MFDLTGKVALVTGGASGIGFSCVKHLLRNNLKAVAIADVSTLNEDNILQEIQNEFGPNRAIFIKTDVSNRNEFENAFKKTIEAFQNVDILINNAAVMNDAMWEEQIKVNFNGTINGCLLAMENFMPNYKIGTEGVILNMSSIAALRATSVFPIYSAIKRGIMGLTNCLALDIQYQRCQVRFLTLCPGGTDTSILSNCENRTLGPFYKTIAEHALPHIPRQS